jgi:arylsulfatase A-like enzyme
MKSCKLDESRRRVSRSLGFCLAAFLLVCASHAATEPASLRPNIVLIMADDLGWGQVGYHGGNYETPNIDRLARSGIRLERQYTAPRCTPTRAALLTGRYPFRYGLQQGVINPGDTHGLPKSETTLAEALADIGYRTAIIGKWHLGEYPDYWPTRRGFDFQYGPRAGMVDYFTHKRDGKLAWFRQDLPQKDIGYATDLFAREAVRFIQAQSSFRPFFLFVPFTAPHTPLQAPVGLIENHRAAGHPRPVMAAMIESLDNGVGSIIDAISERHLQESTVVLFLSDNGGLAPAANAPWRGKKGRLWEGGVRVPAAVTQPGVLPAGSVFEPPVHLVDWFPTFLNLAGGAPVQDPEIDGIDIWNNLLSREPIPERDIVLRVSKLGGALVRGDWKLMVEGSKARLYNLAEDPQETADLAGRMPGLAATLLAAYARYAKQAVEPLDPEASDPPTSGKPLFPRHHHTTVR